MKAAVQLMPARNVSKRVAESYLQKAIRNLTSADLLADASAARKLVRWIRLCHLSFEIVAQLLREDEWKQSVLVKPIVESADLMYLVWTESPKKYKEFVHMHLDELIERYRREDRYSSGQDAG